MSLRITSNCNLHCALKVLLPFQRVMGQKPNMAAFQRKATRTCMLTEKEGGSIE